MMQKTVVIDVVGLSESIISEHTPYLKSYIKKNHLSKIKPVLPAVTTTSQSCYVTGKYPSAHGIVGNGWYDRTDAEVKFWKQSNHLVGSSKIWDEAKKKGPYFHLCQNVLVVQYVFQCGLFCHTAASIPC